MVNYLHKGLINQDKQMARPKLGLTPQSLPMLSSVLIQLKSFQMNLHKTTVLTYRYYQVVKSLTKSNKSREIYKTKINLMKDRWNNQKRRKDDINARLIGCKCIGVRRASIVWVMLGQGKAKEEGAVAD